MRYKISKKAKKVNGGSKIKETVRFRIIRCVCLFAKPSKPKYHYLFYKLTLNQGVYDNHGNPCSFRLIHDHCVKLFFASSQELKGFRRPLLISSVMKSASFIACTVSLLKLSSRTSWKNLTAFKEKSERQAGSF